MLHKGRDAYSLWPPAATFKGLPLSAPLAGGVGLLPHPLPAALSGHLAMHLPGGMLSARDGLTTFRRCNRCGEVGGVSSPVARRPRARSSEPRNLATYLFGRSLSASLACSRDGVYRHFTLSSPYPRSWPPTALRLAVVVSAHAFTTLTRGEEVTLSLELPTSPLPVTPVQVGDCWQNSR